MKIAITGKICSGKSTLANKLKNILKLEKYSFADNVKKYAKEIFEMEYKDRKLEVNLNGLTTDLFTMQLLLMANINNIPEKMTLPVITKAKLKDYQIVNLGAVKLKTIYGERDAILIERIKDESSYRVWADLELYGLPLQVESIKNGKSEYLVKIEDSSLHKASEKITTQSMNRPQSSYFQPR